MDRDKEKIASSYVASGHRNRTRWVRIAQLLVCICRILDRVKSSKRDKNNTILETTYEFPSDHIIILNVV